MLESVRHLAAIASRDTDDACLSSTFSDINSVTVPGAAAAWCSTVEEFGSGRLTMEEILAPAIRMAESGVPVAELHAHVRPLHPFLLAPPTIHLPVPPVIPNLTADPCCLLLLNPGLATLVQPHQERFTLGLRDAPQWSSTQGGRDHDVPPAR
jgi:hypothetical protein